MSKSKFYLVPTLAKLDPCPPAMLWVRLCSGNPYQLWRNCRRGDWLLWLAVTLDLDKKLLVKASCRCARLALQYIPDEEHLPTHSIQAAEAWVKGRAELGSVINASRRAEDVAMKYWKKSSSSYAKRESYDKYLSISYAIRATCRAWYAASAAKTHRADETSAIVSNIVMADCLSRPIEDIEAHKIRQQCATIVRHVIPWRLVRDALEAKSETQE